MREMNCACSIAGGCQQAQRDKPAQEPSNSRVPYLLRMLPAVPPAPATAFPIVFVVAETVPPEADPVPRVPPAPCTVPPSVFPPPVTIEPRVLVTPGARVATTAAGCSIEILPEMSSFLSTKHSKRSRHRTRVCSRVSALQCCFQIGCVVSRRRQFRTKSALVLEVNSAVAAQQTSALVAIIRMNASFLHQPLQSF
jgi:hypothetical protein